jgi:hypothetical protein
MEGRIRRQTWKSKHLLRRADQVTPENAPGKGQGAYVPMARGRFAAWPFLARSELEQAAAAHEKRLRPDMPGLFSQPR